MIDAEKSYDGIYINTIMRRDRLYFYRLTDVETPHRLISGPDGLMLPELAEISRGKIVPVMTLDLSAVNDRISVRLPFFYYEFTDIDWVVSKLDEDGIIEDLLLIDYQKNRYQLDDPHFDYEPDEDDLDDEGDGFEEGLSEIISVLSRQAGKYFEIYSLPVGKEDLNFSKSDRAGYTSFIDGKVTDLFNDELKINRDAVYPRHFGPFTYPIQTGLGMPSINESSDGFYFTGQISAKIFGLYGFEYFLFYNPEERIAAQYMQMT